MFIFITIWFLFFDMTEQDMYIKKNKNIYPFVLLSITPEHEGSFFAHTITES